MLPATITDEKDHSFDAEAWLNTYEPLIRSAARGAFSKFQSREEFLRLEERIGYFKDELVQRFWTMAAFNTDGFRDNVYANKAYLSMSVRNAVVDWLRKESRHLSLCYLGRTSGA